MLRYGNYKVLMFVIASFAATARASEGPICFSHSKKITVITKDGQYFLTLFDSDLADIDGIEARARFPNISSEQVYGLVAKANQITSVNTVNWAGKFTSLRSLDLSGNPLKSLNLNGLADGSIVHLTDVNLNELELVPVDKLMQCTVFYSPGQVSAQKLEVLKEQLAISGPGKAQRDWHDRLCKLKYGTLAACGFGLGIFGIYKTYNWCPWPIATPPSIRSFLGSKAWSMVAISGCLLGKTAGYLSSGAVATFSVLGLQDVYRYTCHNELRASAKKPEKETLSQV